MKVLVLLSLCILCAITTHAQEKPYIFDSYSVNEGLSQSSIFDIAQDDQGFMWFATRDGINRFDGYLFNEYRYKPNISIKPGDGKGELVPRTTSGNRAVINRFDLSGYKGYSFYKDSRNQLLLAHNNGVSIYNKYLNNFTPVLFDTSIVNAAERDNNVKFKVLGEDTLTHTYWIWRPMKGLYVVDRDTYSRKRIIAYPRQFTSAGIIPQFAYKDNDLIWMSYQTGELLALNIHTLQLQTFCLPNVGINPVMRRLNEDSLIIASDGHIIIFNKKRNKFSDRAYEIRNERNEPFIPRTMELDHDGNAWIGGNDGVLIYSIARNDVIRHIVSFNTFETHSFNLVTYLYRDASDNMWVGTDGDGIKKYSPHRKIFNLYRSPFITHNMVESVYKHDDGRLYVGLMNDGLNVYEEGGRFLERISNETYPGKFPASSLAAICREDYEHIWLSFNGMHIGLYNVINRNFTDLTKYIQPLGLPKDPGQFPFLFKRSNGELYFNYGHYLLMFTSEEGKYKVSLVHDFGDELLTTYYEDMMGTQYVGTKSAVYVHHAGQSHWNRVNLPEGSAVKSITKNSHKQALIAGTKGLFVLNEQDQVVQHFNSYDNPKLINDYLYGVLLDDKDKIWVSHNKGLSQINMVTNEITTFDHEDGLQSNEFNTGASFKSVDGELFFGGIRGVNGFYPKNFRNNPYYPKVVIRRMEVLDKPYESDTAVSLLKRVELPYNQNTIALEFVPLEYTNPPKNRVQYKLEGADEDWVDGGTFRMARYTNLHPGKYTFKVRASNNDDIWNTTPTTLEILIRIPFWQSLWFRFLLLLLLLGIAYYFSTLYLDYKIRHEKLKLEKEQAVDQERARISSDMHDDLGSGLSTIRLLSEIAKRKIQDPSQTKEIERISETAGEMVDKMSEIIWAMNSSNDSLANLIAYMRSFAADFLEHAHITHQFYFPETIPNIKLSGGTRRNIYLAVKESLHNVVKHAKATEVVIEVKMNNKNMTIMIKDNGKGFDQEKVRLFGNGLKNIQKRAQAVGGNAEITSNNGTIVFLDIPLN
ncbi:sensor histidine kinase [Chitinophaga sp. Cy-1792]|uniref:sensor histidine kinase n=1 Tax=Chitinophaga sp. Cy-1792 TaxID=2608339 RepID=UPI00141E4837|nr:sensor histidine kinase [Chitinophaga sp. Cy-1792]NIG54321.1 hypothetical protein [Chitinophaga sp. Cy-1792]